MIYDILYNILLQTAAEDMISMCKVSKTTMSICSDPQFWSDKLNNCDIMIPSNNITNTKDWFLYYYINQTLDPTPLIILVLHVNYHVYMDFASKYGYYKLDYIRGNFDFITEADIDIEYVNKYLDELNNIDFIRLNFVFNQDTYTFYFTLQLNNNTSKLISKKLI
jgi:hypothetical protein